MRLNLTAHIWGLNVLLALLILCKLALLRPPKLQIVACDVGQGDAAVISYGQSHILIDTGPKNDVLACLSQEIFWADPVIDVLVLTHGDHDHAGGVDEVRRRYFVTNQVLNSSEQAADPDKTTKFLSGSNQVFTPSAGDEIIAPGLRARVVWSESTRHSTKESLKVNPNADSVGLQFAYGSFGFLTLGDLECQQELAVAYMGLLKTTNFLKLSHHGAKTSSCVPFLQKINPEAAFVSVGADNSYGHPTGEVLKNLDNLGIYLWRTDQLGTVSWEVGATKMWWKSNGQSNY